MYDNYSFRHNFCVIAGSEAQHKRPVRQDLKRTMFTQTIFMIGVSPFCCLSLSVYLPSVGAQVAPATATCPLSRCAQFAGRKWMSPAIIESSRHARWRMEPQFTICRGSFSWQLGFSRPPHQNQDADFGQQVIIKFNCQCHKRSSHTKCGICTLYRCNTVEKLMRRGRHFNHFGDFPNNDWQLVFGQYN